MTKMFVRFSAILGYVLVAIFPLLRAQEIVFFSLPEEKVNSEFTHLLQRTTSHNHLLLNGVWTLKHPEQDSILGVVRVPCTFQNTNAVRLEKKFVITKKAGESYRLYAGMINGEAEIRLNDSLLVRTRQDYYPISIYLPATLVKNGENTLRVTIRRIRNRFNATPAFFPLNIPRIDTGILDGVYLEILPPVAIKAITVSPDFGDSLVYLNGAITLTHPLPDTTVYSLRLSLFRGQQRLFHHQLPFRQPGARQIKFPRFSIPQPTSTDLPGDVFRLEATLDSLGHPVDTRRQPVAIREIKITNRGATINGITTVLNGLNYVYQTREGSELFDPVLIRKDLMDIKQRGFNAIRVVLHPMPEEFYRICDEVGLWCFQDLPFVFTGVRKKERQAVFKNWYRYYRYLTKMATRYRSLVAIGVGFYIDGTSTHEKNLLASFLQRLPGKPLPIYTVTMLPNPDPPPEIDFRLIDFSRTHHLREDFIHLQSIKRDHIFFPVIFPHGISPEDSLISSSPTIPALLKFYHQLTSDELPGKIPGNFFMSYHDYYDYLPAVPNGFHRNPFLNPIGFQTIQRNPKPPFRSLRQSTGKEFNATAKYPLPVFASRATLNILLGILNLFFFLLPFKRFKLFRQNIIHSIKKPHGFFVNLQERIYIPYRQSFFLLLVISMNGALVHGAVVYYFRENPVLDYALSLICISPEIKRIAVQLIWNPIFFLVFDTLLIIVIFYIMAILMKILTMVGFSRVRFGQALAVSIWAAAPFVLLLPLGIVMYSLLLFMKSYWIFLFLLLYFHVLYYFRWINGARVLMGRLYSRVLISVTAILLIFLAGSGYLYQHYLNGMVYWQYAYHLFKFFH